MAVNLSGVRFDQIYGDNTGSVEFDTDRDGTATQEDEFVSFTNDAGTPIDVSGWQIWSDSAGGGSPDDPQDGLYHTFPPGTVLQPGETLYIINEISGAEPSWAQEASEGGVESGAGGQNTNFLTEGSGNSSHSESIALVDPASGDYIVFNMSSNSPEIENVSGFPGTNKVGEVDGASVQGDQDAGSSYSYNSQTDDYQYSGVFTPCFVAGTKIETATGLRRVETLKTRDLVATLDHGFQPIQWVGKRIVDLSNPANDHLRPVYVGRLGVSPQHRLLTQNDTLAPAKGLLHMADISRDTRCQLVAYYHLLLPQHDIIFAESIATESLLPGPTFLATCRMSDRLKIHALGLSNIPPARPCLTVSQSRRLKHSQGLLVPIDWGKACVQTRT